MRKINEIEKDLEKLKNEIEEVQDRIQELEVEKEKVLKNNGRWKPSQGEYYYYYNYYNYNNKKISWHIWKDDGTDNYYYETRNCFKTKEEAKEYLKYQEALDEVTYEFTNKEWENKHLYKYYLCYDYADKKIYVLVAYLYRDMNCRYFKTEKEAQNFVAKYKKQILKFEFDINE